MHHNNISNGLLMILSVSLAPSSPLEAVVANYTSQVEFEAALVSRNTIHQVRMVWTNLN